MKILLLAVFSIILLSCNSSSQETKEKQMDEEATEILKEIDDNQSSEEVDMLLDEMNETIIADSSTSN